MKPDGVPPDAVLAAVRAHWETPVDEASYLLVGFGAHHWQLTCGGLPVLFATVDKLAPRRSAAELEGAYRAAAELAECGAMIAALHETPAPSSIPKWPPFMIDDYVLLVEHTIERPWHTEPHARRLGVAPAGPS